MEYCDFRKWSRLSNTQYRITAQTMISHRRQRISIHATLNFANILQNSLDSPHFRLTQTKIVAVVVAGISASELFLFSVLIQCLWHAFRRDDCNWNDMVGNQCILYELIIEILSFYLPKFRLRAFLFNALIENVCDANIYYDLFRMDGWVSVDVLPLYGTIATIANGVFKFKHLFTLLCRIECSLSDRMVRNYTFYFQNS